VVYLTKIIIMKKICTLVALMLTIMVTSQVTNEGSPLSWDALNDQDQIEVQNLPGFDLEAVKAEDEIDDPKFEKPWRFGFMHSVDFGFEDGKWTTLDNGDRIWRIAVESKGALSLNFVFDEFYVPKGGSVYLYSDDRSDLLGAYTHVQNQESGILGTWLVQGEKVWIEYFEPAKMQGTGKLHIAKATHGYRSAETFNQEKGLNDSGNCNLDVDCSVGSDYDQLKELNKRSVGILLSGSSGFCTGALINNTNNDGTPFFLTANHCFSNPASWAFRFGWISPNPVCAATNNSTNGPTNLTLSGATLRARSTNADFCLVEINNDIPSDWNRVFSGWDRSDNFPSFTVGVHHPSGDIMKVCRDDDAPTKEINNGAQTWEILGGSGQGWELGVTEPGSSGSPLYDPQGRIIGQLFGGAAACSGTNDNNALDFYGRFAVSWDAGSSATTRLEDWLDPAGTNPTTIDSNPPFEVFALDGTLSITIPDVDCGVTEFSPTISLTNLGVNDITSATISWDVNGGTAQTIDFNGTLVQNETEQFVLDPIDFQEGESTINAEITQINGANDDNPNNNNISNTFDVGGDSFGTTQVQLDLLTDDWAQETTWEFRTTGGTVLYNGGPYQESADDNTLFTEFFDVDLSQCYEFEIFDTAGDGICCGFGIGSYELTTDTGAVIFSGGEFGDSELTEVRIASTLGSESNTLSNVALYPNPANSQITIALSDNSANTSFRIINLLGQNISNGMITNRSTAINVDSYKTGLYFVVLKDEVSNNEITLKFIKQ
jgi:lysyl endopeptidase